MIRTKFLFLPVVLFLWMTGAYAASALAAEEDAANSIWVEQLIEERLRSVLIDVIGTDRFIVIVNADVREDADAGRRQEAFLLPGVPIRKEAGETASASSSLRAALTKLSIRKLAIIVLLNTGASESLKQTVREITGDAVGLNAARGDVVEVKEVNVKGKSIAWSSLFRSSNVSLILLSVGGGFFLAAAGLFLLHPLRRLPETLNSVDWGQVRGNTAPVPGQDAQQSLTERSGISHSAAPAVQPEDRRDPSTPFSFIEERHIPDLAFLLTEGPAQDVAIVANYLPAELAAKLLNNLPVDRQTEAAVCLGSPAIDPERTQTLEETVRKRLDYVVGGQQKLAALLEASDEEIRNRVFSRLDSSDAEAARRLREKVKDLETLLQGLSPGDMPVLYRNLDPVLFAQVLKTLPDDIRNKVTSSLSAGAVERLQQEMDLARPLPPGRLRKEKLAVLRTVRRMITNGLLHEEND